MRPAPRFLLLLSAPLTASLPVFLSIPAHAAPESGAPSAVMSFVELPAGSETIRQLRKGGFTLYMRHGTTDNTRADRVPSVDLDDCATQRPLTEEGRQMARQVGKAVRSARIPIGEIHISPLCRVKESTAAAFPGRACIVDHKLMYTANLTDAEKAPIIANTRHLLSAPVTPGSNRLIVAHAPNLMDVIGYFPKEGTLVIFKPKTEKIDGEVTAGFDYIASIPPKLWQTLLRAEKP